MQKSQSPWGNSRNKAISRRAAVGGGVAFIAGLGGVAWALDSKDKLPGVHPTPSPSPTSTPSPVPTTAPTVIATFPEAPATSVASPEATPKPVPAADLLVEARLSDLRSAIDDGSVTIVELVQATLDRIAAMDGDTTHTILHAVIETNPDALAIAASLDDELQNGKSRGPLHGIPVLVKDVFASGDQMKTTAGALALAENTVVEDAFVVARLRDAGMVLMGKANMSEWSSFRSSGLGSGWSGRGGQASNPYVLDRTPWGSSAGSAISVAASYVPFSLGAETDGSILCPSSACGVVGLKPTVGLTSRIGVIPISSTQDSPGAIARNVHDLAVFFSAIAGYDPEDSAYNEFSGSAPASEFTTWPVPDVGAIDYTRGLDANALNGMRIGVARSCFGWDAEADAAMNQTITLLANAGVDIVDNIWFDTDLSSDDEYSVLITEFPYMTQRFFDRFMPDGPIGSLADVIDWNDANPAPELTYGDQVVLQRAVDVGTTIDDPWYLDVRAKVHAASRDNGIDATMDANTLDALIAPTAPVPAVIDSYGDAGFTGSSAQISALAGYPAINLPIGLVRELPVGMNIFGRAFSEPTLLRIAYGFEQILQARTLPTYIPSIGPDATPVDEASPAGEDTPVEEDTPVDGE